MKNVGFVPVFAVIYFLLRYQDSPPPPPPPPKPIPDISQAVKNTFDEWEKNPQLDPRAQFKANQFYEAGVKSQNQGDHGIAIAWFNESIKIIPTADNHNARAKSLLAMTRYDESIKDLNAAIAIDPTFAFAYWGRGKVMEELENFGEALNDYSKAINLAPENADIHVSRGSLYCFELNDYKKSVGDFTKAVELDPMNWGHYAHRALTHYKYEHYDLAVRDNTLALERMTVEIDDTNRARVYFARHKSYENLGETEKSSADYRRAKELDSSVLR